MKRKWYRQGSALLREIETTVVADRNTLAVWYLGQCGFVFKNQVTVYIDPVLNDMTDDAGNTRRLYPAPFPADLVRADYVLCTHGHIDHLAPETLSAIARSDSHTRFIVPGGCRTLLTESGIAEGRILSARAHHRLELPGLSVFPVSAAHPAHKKDENGEDLALCYQLTMGNVSLLHPGDTYLTDQLLDDFQALPAPHLFFPPINGGDYFRTKRNCIGNLSPVESATLSALLHADIAIPTHFDMVEGNTADPLIFVRELWKKNPAAKWHIPALGERFIYSADPEHC